MIAKEYKVEDLAVLKIKAQWSFFKSQHFSFWMICCYLFFEFVRPQAIFPSIDILPWAQVFIAFSIMGAFLDPSVKWTSTIANLLIVLFFLLIMSSIYLTSSYPDVSKRHIIDFFGWFVIYFLIINIVNTKERLFLFIIIFMVTSAKIAIGTSKSWALRGFSFTSWGLSGPQGYFQNSGELAILMLVLFPLAFYLYSSTKDKCGKWEARILILFWVCPILTILGASSRGAQIALAVLICLMFRKSMFKVKPLIGFVVLCSAIFYLLPEEQKNRFTTIGEDKTSQQRTLYWQHGIDIIQEYPLTGVGFFNFIPYYEDHFREDMLYEHAELPHNIFIQVATDAGVIAASIFGLIIGYCLITTRNLVTNTSLDPLWKAIAAGLGLGVFGYLLAGQFVTVAYYPFLWIHLALIVSLKEIFLKDKMPNKLTRR